MALEEEDAFIGAASGTADEAVPPARTVRSWKRGAAEAPRIGRNREGIVTRADRRRWRVIHQDLTTPPGASHRVGGISALRQSITCSGVYRLEAYRGGRGWLYTNPIYVRD